MRKNKNGNENYFYEIHTFCIDFLHNNQSTLEFVEFAQNQMHHRRHIQMERADRSFVVPRHILQFYSPKNIDIIKNYRSKFLLYFGISPSSDNFSGKYLFKNFKSQKLY